jgi:predicted CopG family antitoxin
MASKAKRLIQIAVDEENYEALRMLGRTPDSFNDIITRILREKQNQTPLAPKVCTPGGQDVEPSKPHDGGKLGVS